MTGARSHGPSGGLFPLPRYLAPWGEGGAVIPSPMVLVGSPSGSGAFLRVLRVSSAVDPGRLGSGAVCCFLGLLLLKGVFRVEKKDFVR